MIIYGSRMYGRKDPVKGWGFCDSCGRYSQHTSYGGSKWGHIYFIPLIPMGARVRVTKQCGSCSNGMHIPEKSVPSVLDDLRRVSGAALAALSVGQKEFDNNGTATSCIGCLVGSVELLYCLCAQDHVEFILSSLQECGLTYEHCLVEGESLEFHSRLEEAAALYWQAAECEPAEAFPLMSLGLVHLKQNDYEGARSIYESALELSEDKPPVLEVLLTVYENLKDHARVAETYEQCLAIMPELAQDKKVIKAYRSACKKAGKEPVVT